MITSGPIRLGLCPNSPFTLILGMASFLHFQTVAKKNKYVFPEQGWVIHSPRRFDLFSLTVTKGRKLNGELPHGAKQALFSAPVRAHGICMSALLLALILVPYLCNFTSSQTLSAFCLYSLTASSPSTFLPSRLHYFPSICASHSPLVCSVLFLYISSLHSDSCLPFSLFPIPSSSSSPPCESWLMIELVHVELVREWCHFSSLIDAV